MKKILVRCVGAIAPSVRSLSDLRPRTRRAVILAAIAVTAASIAVGSSARAGYSEPSEIWVQYPTHGEVMAGGSLTSALRSSDARQFIGCSIDVEGTTTIVQCDAQNAQGQHASCVTSAPAIINAVSGMNQFSYISFYGVRGICEEVFVTYDSIFGRE